jgi:hypothetical protein
MAWIVGLNPTMTEKGELGGYSAGQR